MKDQTTSSNSEIPSATTPEVDHELSKAELAAKVIELRNMLNTANTTFSNLEVQFQNTKKEHVGRWYLLGVDASINQLIQAQTIGDGIVHAGRVAAGAGAAGYLGVKGYSTVSSWLARRAAAKAAAKVLPLEVGEAVETSTVATAAWF